MCSPSDIRLRAGSPPARNGKEGNNGFDFTTDEEEAVHWRAGSKVNGRPRGEMGFLTLSLRMGLTGLEVGFAQ